MAAQEQERELLVNRPNYPSLPNWVEGQLESVKDGKHVTVEEAAENARARFKRGEDDREGDDDLVNYYYTVMQYRSAEGRKRKPKSREVRRSRESVVSARTDPDHCGAGAGRVDRVRRQAQGEVRKHKDQVDH